MTIILPNYKTCDQSMFDRAMDKSMRAMHVWDLSDQDLYIRYTKYEADLVTLDKAEGSYAMGIRIETKQMRDALLAECNKRGIDTATGETPRKTLYPDRETFDRTWPERNLRRESGRMMKAGNNVRFFMTARRAATAIEVVYVELLTGPRMKNELRTVFVPSTHGIASAKDWEVLDMAAEHAIRTARGHLVEQRDRIDRMLASIEP